MVGLAQLSILTWILQLTTSCMNHPNRIGAGLGQQLIKQWVPDYNYIRWGDTQQQLCEQLGIAPSSTIIFGVDSNEQYPQYNRGATTNRLCLSKYLFTEDLPYDQAN